MAKKTKFIFLTGGVYSSLGKGITASSIGRILKELGFIVAMQKLDPYLNIDPDYISPYQHGEVFVTDDGAEADLDLGNYERFTNKNLNKYSTVTSGRIYDEVLTAERQGKYDGRTVQVVPHITNKVMEKLFNLAKTNNADFAIIEIGGTIGDIESLAFIETINQFSNLYGRQNIMNIHCVPLISINTVVGELKTKPAQNSVKSLRSFGVNPDLLVLRSSEYVDDETISKISWTCGIRQENIFINPDLPSIYFLPNTLYEQKIHEVILKHFNRKIIKNTFNDWLKFTNKINTPKSKVVKVGIVGQYAELHDAYFSVFASLKLACYELGVDYDIQTIQIQSLKTVNDYKNVTDHYDALILCPTDTEEAQILNIKFMKHLASLQIPTLVYSYGFEDLLLSQLEPFLKNVKPYTGKDPCFILQKRMILGKRDVVVKDSRLTKWYHQSLISERHRQKYLFNLKYLPLLKQTSLEILGTDSDDNPTYVALKDHPYFIGTYANVEFTSRPSNPNPLYFQLIKAAIK